MLGTILWALIGGTILGYLGKLLLPGRQDIPAWATIGAGIVAMLIAGVVARWLGVADTSGIDWWEHLIQVVFAVIVIYATARVFSRRQRRGSKVANY